MESHVFSWSRSRFSKLSESVFLNCWSRSRFFKTAGVESGDRVGKFVAITDSNVY